MKTFLLFTTCIILFSCKKNNTTAPTTPTNITTTIPCDTIDCLEASAQCYIIFQAGNSEDTTIVGGILNIRYQYADSGYLPFDPVKHKLIHYKIYPNNFNIAVMNQSELNFIMPAKTGGGRWMHTKTGKGLYFKYYHR